MTTMKRDRWVWIAALCAMGSAAATACGGEDGDGGNGAEVDAGTSSTSSSSSSSSSSSGSTSSSSSSSSSSSTSSSSGGDAGTDAALCEAPESAFIDPLGICEAPDDNTNTVAYQPLVGTPTYTGGPILPGVYATIKVETLVNEETPAGVSAEWILDEDGLLARSLTYYDVPELGGDITLYGYGTYSGTGNTLALQFGECRNIRQSPTEQYSYTARSEGCDDLIEYGTATLRFTLRRIRLDNVD